MTKMYATVLVLMTAMRERVSARFDRRAAAPADAGFGTLEWVLITLFVLGAATAAVAIVGTAITSRTSQIS